MSKDRNETTWKQFEELVTRIEQTLSDVNAKVKHNDQIVDRYGDLRQVDASVRINTGTSEILIIIECRRRKKVSDVTWVEQVYTKKDNLRADRAILVSSNTLSVPAQRMAKDKGIEIRSLEEIPATLMPREHPHRFEFGTLGGWEVERLEVRPSQSEVAAGWQESFQAAIQASDPIFISIEGGPRLSLIEVIKSAVQGEKVPSPPPGENEVKGVFELVTSGAAVELQFGGYVVPLRLFRIHAIAKVTLFESSVVHAKYKNDSGKLDHFVTSAKSESIPQAFTAIKKAGQDGFRLNIPYEFFNEEARKDLDPEKGAVIDITIGSDGFPNVRKIL